MATFWERAAHSVCHMLSLYFDFLYHFGFEGETLVLIASVSGLCLSFTLNTTFSRPFLD